MARPKKTKEKKPRVPKKVIKVKKPPKEKKVKQNANIVFFDKLVASAENDLAQAASNGIISGDVTGWIDTGVYMLNAQYSGSLFGGVPDNKILVFAGPEAVGKTYFILSIVKFFLDSNPEAGVVFCESEGAISKEMLVERGIDTTRVWVVPVSTVQEWRTQSLKVLASYKAAPEDERRPMMFCLDSLGMLSTTKEMEDTEAGSEKQDMTRARLIKAAFRTMTLKLGVLHVPFLITNHTYDTQGLFSTKTMSGGCLVAGTKIQLNSFDTRYGRHINYKNIEDIKIGEYVDTLIGPRLVTDTFQFTDKEIFKITLENDEIIECSGDHKFLVNGSWIDTYNLFAYLKEEQSINISDIKTGDMNVLGEQIQENLLQTC
jgi:hypothetical protein